LGESSGLGGVDVVRPFMTGSYIDACYFLGKF